YTVTLTVLDDDNAPGSTTRTVTAVSGGWWKRSGSGGDRLTLNWTGIGEALTDFPILVRLDPSRIDYSAVQPNGADLRFIDADGVTVLNYEIATWNPNGVSTVWVKVPRVEANSTTDYVWLYY